MAKTINCASVKLLKEFSLNGIAKFSQVDLNIYFRKKIYIYVHDFVNNYRLILILAYLLSYESKFFKIGQICENRL